jgi:catechol 2,3-dioxygenase-like lactoylglutathione lyase family enzyme
MSMRFDHVGVLVADLEAAKAFARDVLGLGEAATEFTAPEHGLAGAFFGMGEGRLELFTLENAAETQRLPAGETSVVDHVAVKVADLDAEQERLSSHGVTFTGPATEDPIEAPIDLRGSRHLWTAPESSGGFRMQLIEG